MKELEKITTRIKRFTTILLSLVMLIGLLPNTVYAAKGSSEAKLKKAYDETKTSVYNSMVKTASKDTLFGSEWYFMGLARSGYIDYSSDLAKKYFKSASEKVKETGEQIGNTPSDNARVIIALTSVGFDPENIEGKSLIKGLEDFSYATKGTINNATWSLIALRTKGFADETCNKLVDNILGRALSGGGWVLSELYGKSADVDVTAMTIQALAPYYKKRSDVKAAVDKALTLLSQRQGSTGGYDVSYNGGITSESIAQVIVALTSLGLDPDSDSRFIKNGYSLMDALSRFAVDGGGFKHLEQDGVDAYATGQGLYALAAYYRFKEGKTALYDMSDVKKQSNPTEPVTPDPVDPIKIKKAKFKKSSYTLTYNSSTAEYNNSPLDLAAELTLTASDKSTIKAPFNGTTVEWRITKGDSLINIDANGVVTPKFEANGTAKVKAIVHDATNKDKTAQCTIKLKGPAKVKSIKAVVEGTRKATAKIDIEDTIILEAIVGPDEAKNKDVDWTVDKGSDLVKIVESNGKTCKVTALSAGKVKIVAKAKDGSNKKGTFNLTVKPKSVASVVINEGSTKRVKLGDTVQFTATVSPDDASVKDVTWKSKKTGIAKIDKNGLMTTLKVGEVDIVVTTKGKNKSNKKETYTCHVEVYDPATETATGAK